MPPRGICFICRIMRDACFSQTTHTQSIASQTGVVSDIYVQKFMASPVFYAYRLSHSSDELSCSTVVEKLVGPERFIVWNELDRTRRKASTICLRSPLTFTPGRSPGNALRPQIWPVLLSRRGAIIRKINRARPKSSQFCRWSGQISNQNFRPFPSYIILEMPGNTKFGLFL